MGLIKSGSQSALDINFNISDYVTNVWDVKRKKYDEVCHHVVPLFYFKIAAKQSLAMVLTPLRITRLKTGAGEAFTLNLKL